MMKMQSLFTSTLFLTACGLHASDTAQVDAAKQYPFSELDKELFFNYDTEKMESPYSTASVNSFSTDSLVTIEEDAYNKLHAYALKRCSDITCTALQDARNTPQENYTARQLYKRIESAANASAQQFKSIKTTGRHSEKIQLSPRNLAHLLQYTQGIITVFLTFTGSKHDIVFEVKLGETTYPVDNLLKDFILANGAHDQPKRYRWINEPEKN